MPVRVAPLSLEQFDALQSDWNALLKRSASDRVFLRWEWIHTWWELFKTDRRLLLLAAWQDQQLVGLAPFYLDSVRPYSLRQIRFCAEELSPDYCDVIVEKGREIDVVQAFLSYLEEQSLPWDTLSIENMRTDAILLRALEQWTTMPQRKYAGLICPHIQIEGSFAEYVAQRKGINHLEKTWSQLSKKYGVRHERLRDLHGLPLVMDELFRLHEARARTLRRMTVFTQPAIQRFHQIVSGLFLREKILNVHVLWHQGKALSVLYAYDYNDCVSFFQSGFDPEWNRFSVGALLLYRVIEEAFQNGRKEFDFLKGAEPYKFLWSNAVHNEIGITLYNRTLRAKAYSASTGFKAALRGFKRSIRLCTDLIASPASVAKPRSPNG